MKEYLISSLSLNTRLSTIEAARQLVLDLSEANLALVLGELQVASWLPLHQSTMFALFSTLVLCVDILGTSSGVGV